MNTFQLLATVIFAGTTLCIVALGIAAFAGISPPGSRRRYAIGAGVALVGWMALTGGLAALGVLNDFSVFPPRIMPVVALSMVAVVGITVSRLGERLAIQTPLAWLVGFQIFRIAVEIGLALLHYAGIVPVQMTFEGRNWDILSGLVAVEVAWLASRRRLSRNGLLLWNLLGLGLLLNILVVSIVSMPTPFRMFQEGPANTFIATFPFVWLPAILVPAALLGHLLVFRRLLGRSTLRPNNASHHYS